MNSNSPNSPPRVPEIKYTCSSKNNNTEDEKSNSPSREERLCSVMSNHNRKSSAMSLASSASDEADGLERKLDLKCLIESVGTLLIPSVSHTLC